MNEIPLEDIQSRIEREEFARGHLPEGAPPVTPRAAATTVLARPAPHAPFELLLLQRTMTTRFAAGAYVFPGGVVDDDDDSPFWNDRLPDMVNLPDDGLPAAVGAIRELFEETGLLLSDTRVADLPALEAARADLLRGEATLEDVSRSLGVTFAEAPITYFARWVTPSRMARRYDALFFLVALPDRTDAVSITDEHDGIEWVTPDDALARFRAGALPMLFPTWKTVEQLARFESLEEAAADLGGEPVRSIEPLLDVRGNSVMPRMPDNV